jgi:arylsulfatase A
MTRSTWLLAASWSLLMGGEAHAQGQPQPPQRPNIVAILTDDQGYGDLGSYGHPTIRTPRLDEMAREGTRLTSFYAAPVCTPARAMFLTGRYPFRSGLVSPLGPGSRNGMPDAEITLAEALKEQGYRTAMIGKWHLGDQPEHNPTVHGFDRYFGLPYSNDYMPPFVAGAPPIPLYSGMEVIERPFVQENQTQRFTAEALHFIRESAGQPFFLYFAPTMPHLPIFASQGFQGRSRAGRYGDVIEELDASVGQILDALDELGLDGNTIVIFMSDNGPWLGATNPGNRMMQDGMTPYDVGSPGPLRGWKATTYEGGPRVPAIVRWPGVIPGGQISSEITTIMDWYPMLLRIGGARIPGDRPIDGIDILPMLQGLEPWGTREFFYFSGTNLEAIRHGPWKLRVAAPQQPNAPSVEPELYHLEVDISERFNVAGDHPELVAGLRERLEAFWREVESSDPGQPSASGAYR